MTRSETVPLACLWELEWDENRLACRIYRGRSSLQLRVESPTAIILSERFRMEPQALSRARALRDSLKRRGWTENRRV